MKNRLMKGSLAALVSLLATNAMAAQEVTVYTAFETDILAKYKSAFEKDNPDIKIKWVRDSTGIMTAKLLAEKNNPQAEVVWSFNGRPGDLFLGKSGRCSTPPRVRGITFVSFGMNS